MGRRSDNRLENPFNSEPFMRLKVPVTFLSVVLSVMAGVAHAQFPVSSNDPGHSLQDPEVAAAADVRIPQAVPGVI